MTAVHGERAEVGLNPGAGAIPARVFAFVFFFGYLDSELHLLTVRKKVVFPGQCLLWFILDNTSYPASTHSFPFPTNARINFRTE